MTGAEVLDLASFYQMLEIVLRTLRLAQDRFKKYMIMKRSCYILLCGDGSYYTGSTHNLQQRQQEHMSGNGTLWSSFAQPVELVYHEDFDSHEDAVKREKEIKGWSRKKKETLIKGDIETLVKASKSCHPTE